MITTGVTLALLAGIAINAQSVAPGGVSLRNTMLPHGPGREAFDAALQPQKIKDTMTFMLKTRFPQHLSTFAASEAPLFDDVVECWHGLAKKFDGTPDPN